MILDMGWRWQAGVAKKGVGYKGPSWDGGYVGSLLNLLNRSELTLPALRAGQDFLNRFQPV